MKNINVKYAVTAVIIMSLVTIALNSFDVNESYATVVCGKPEQRFLSAMQNYNESQKESIIEILDINIVHDPENPTKLYQIISGKIDEKFLDFDSIYVGWETKQSMETFPESLDLLLSDCSMGFSLCFL